MEIQDNSISPQCRDRACFFSVIHIASYFLWGREGYNFFEGGIYSVISVRRGGKVCFGGVCGIGERW